MALQLNDEEVRTLGSQPISLRSDRLTICVTELQQGKEESVLIANEWERAAYLVVETTGYYRFLNRVHSEYESAMRRTTSTYGHLGEVSSEDACNVMGRIDGILPVDVLPVLRPQIITVDRKEMREEKSAQKRRGLTLGGVSNCV